MQAGVQFWDAHAPTHVIALDWNAMFHMVINCIAKADMSCVRHTCTQHIRRRSACEAEQATSVKACGRLWRVREQAQVLHTIRYEALLASAQVWVPECTEHLKRSCNICQQIRLLL